MLNQTEFPNSERCYTLMKSKYSLHNVCYWVWHVHRKSIHNENLDVSSLFLLCVHNTHRKAKLLSNFIPSSADSYQKRYRGVEVDGQVFRETSSWFITPLLSDSMNYTIESSTLSNTRLKGHPSSTSRTSLPFTCWGSTAVQRNNIYVQTSKMFYEAVGVISVTQGEFLWEFLLQNNSVDRRGRLSATRMSNSLFLKVGHWVELWSRVPKCR